MSSVCLHSEFIFPSITEGGNIKAATESRELDVNRQQRRSIDLFILCGV